MLNIIYGVHEPIMQLPEASLFFEENITLGLEHGVSTVDLVL
jgi:hypothetical protein